MLCSGGESCDSSPVRHYLGYVSGVPNGLTISITVWFVLEEENVCLLQWHRNVLKNPSIRIDARRGAEFQGSPITNAKAVKSVVERFREKYGPKDVKKYYSKFDVAVFVGFK